MRRRRRHWFLGSRLNVQVCLKRSPKPLCFSLRTRPPSSRVRPSLSMAANWPANSRVNRYFLHETTKGTTNKMTGNTIFITGGGSGIGRGLAETLHRLGNQVIISGRRKGHLAETTKANPGMKSVELDVEDPASVAAVTRKLIEDYPILNVLINNAGVMHIDNAAGAIDEALLVSTIATNLMGPIRMTGALIDHLKKQDHAAVMNVSSVLGFVPLAMAAVYSSTKAAIHSYTLSLRYQLKGSSVDRKSTRLNSSHVRISYAV